jgi:hypothetical protein
LHTIAANDCNPSARRAEEERKSDSMEGRHGRR